MRNESSCAGFLNTYNLTGRIAVKRYSKSTALWAISLFMVLGMNSPTFSSGNEWLVYTQNSTGLPNNSVNSFYEDADGGMWFGTLGGVAVLKDDKWTIYNTQNSMLPNDNVQRIIASADGAVWMGTDGGVVRLHDDEWTVYTSENSGLTENAVRAMVFDDEGTLWVGLASRGFFSFDGQEWTEYSISSSGLTDNNVRSLAFDSDGKLYIGTFFHGLQWFDGEDWGVYRTNNSDIPDDRVHDIVISDEGNIWVGTSAGVARFDGENWTTYNATNSDLPRDLVATVRLDSEGRLWTGMLNSTVMFDGEEWTIYDTSGSTADIFFDSNGDVWIGTISNQFGSGARRINSEGEITLYTDYTTGLITNQVLTIHVGANRHAWVGAQFGLMRLREDTWDLINNLYDDFTDGDFRDKLTGPDGRVWIATSFNGLYAYDGASWSHYTQDNSILPNNNLRTLTVGPDGALWVGTAFHGMIRFDENNPLTYNTENSDLPNNTVEAIEFDNGGVMWIGTLDGVARVDGDTWTVFKENDSDLGLKRGYRIAIDINDGVWIASDISFDGMSHFDGATWSHYDTDNSGLPNNDIRALMFDGNGALWIGTNGGGAARLEGTNWTVFNMENSELPGNTVRDFSIDPNGNIWMATNGGLALYNENGVDVSADQPVTQIPVRFMLEQNYPNPFNPATTIAFTLEEAGIARLVVYDLLGREVARLADGHHTSGSHSVTFSPYGLSSGVYLYRLEASGAAMTRKMVLVK